MEFETMTRLVFAGDSVTDMGSSQPVGEGLKDRLGFGYVRMVENLLAACYPERLIRVTNSGVSGNTSRDLLARWERDVLALKPDYLSICIGINDVWRQFDCPAMPDTLALRPSSRRLGGTWEKEKQRCCPSAGQPRPGTPFGPFFLAWRAVPTPPLPQLLGFQDAHSRLWPSGAVWTWEWPQRPHPGRAQELYSLRHPALQAAGAIGSIQFSTQTVVMVTKEGA